MTDWLDGTVDDHSCSLQHAYDGYEILEGICKSAMEHVRVDLPLTAKDTYDMFARMRTDLPECPERKPR